MKKTVEEMLELIMANGFSEVEFRELNYFMVNEINKNINKKVNEIKKTIQEGSIVTANHPSLLGKEFQILTVKRTKARMKQLTAPYTTYNISISLLTAK